MIEEGNNQVFCYAGTVVGERSISKQFLHTVFFNVGRKPFSGFEYLNRFCRIGGNNALLQAEFEIGFEGGNLAVDASGLHFDQAHRGHPGADHGRTDGLGGIDFKLGFQKLPENLEIVTISPKGMG